MTKLKGISVALVTPMDAQENVDLTTLRTQARRQIDAGMHGLFCLGTNGEGYILSMDEKLRIIEAVVDETAGRVPVYAGTGCVSTRDTLALSKSAQAMGVDAVTVITPYFAAASQQALYAHFARIADTVDIPVILYNIPARTMNALSVELTLRLARETSVAGIKDSSGNFDAILQIIEAAPEDFSVLCGTDSLILPALIAGGDGAVSGMANLFPGTLVEIYEAFLQGDIPRARTAQQSLRPLRSLFAGGNPNTIVKRALNLLGFPAGPCRAPFGEIDPALDQRLASLIDTCYAMHKAVPADA